MKKRITNTTGYILAGGKSSRMGEDKGLKLLAGKPMIETVIDQLKLAVDKVVIVSNSPHYSKLKLEVTEDIIKHVGPAGGIYTALQHSTTGKNFIVSCDMPFVTAKSIAFMLRNGKDSEITLPKIRGKIEPLFGVYSKNCLSKWKVLMDEDYFKIQDMVRYFNLKIIDVDDNILFSEKLFINLNTCKDFNDAIKIL